MWSADALFAVTRRAPRARLVRFLAFADRRRQAWKGPLDGDTDQQIRDAAFVVADRWVVRRRADRQWRRRPTRQIA